MFLFNIFMLLYFIDDTYFKVALYSTPCVSCGLLYLVSQLITKKPQLHAVTLKSTTLTQDSADDDDEEEEEKYVDAKEDVDLQQVEDALEASSFLYFHLMCYSETK